MTTLTALSTSIRNVSQVLDTWVKPLERTTVPNWEALERATGILARLMQIEKTIIALQRHPQLADKRYIKQLADAIGRLQALSKLWNSTRELEIKLTPLPKISSPSISAGLATPSIPQPSSPTTPTSPTPTPQTTSTPHNSAATHECNADIPVCEKTHSTPITPNPTTTSTATHEQGSADIPVSTQAPISSTPRDPFNIPPARLSPPTQPSPLYQKQPTIHSPAPTPASPSENSSLITPHSSLSSSAPPDAVLSSSFIVPSSSLNLDPQPATRAPQPALPIPTIRAITLLTNWHQSLTHPELIPKTLNHLQTRIETIAAQLKTFFITLGTPPYSKPNPFAATATLPIITFTYPTKSPPRPSPLIPMPPTPNSTPT